jgi:hypothetical protein
MERRIGKKLKLEVITKPPEQLLNVLSLPGVNDSTQENVLRESVRPGGMADSRKTPKLRAGRLSRSIAHHVKKLWVKLSSLQAGRRHSRRLHLPHYFLVLDISSVS